MTAKGDKCEICLVGVPLSDVSGLTDLAGKIWDSGTERSLDTCASEGHVKAGRFYLSFRNLKAKCKSVDVTKSILTLSFQAEMEDCVNGGSGDVDCGLRCDIREKR